MRPRRSSSISTTRCSTTKAARVSRLPLCSRHTRRCAPCRSMRSSGRTRGFSKSCTARCCSVACRSRPRATSGSGGCSRAVGAEGRPDRAARSPRCTAIRIGRGEDRSPGRAALMAAIKRHARVGIVSNNLLDEQQEKLQVCGFDPFVDALVVSEEAGVSKPDPAIFRMRSTGFDVEPAQSVMVGDSWAADIEGARAAGIRAIWFNPSGAPLPDPGADVGQLKALEPADTGVRLILESHRHRSRRHEDRNHRARPVGRERFRQRIPTPRGDYDGTLEARGAGRRSRGRRRTGDRRHRHARNRFAGHRAGEECQLDLAERPASGKRRGRRARTRGAPCQRRQLLCAVGSRRWRSSWRRSSSA